MQKLNPAVLTVLAVSVALLTLNIYNLLPKEGSGPLTLLILQLFLILVSGAYYFGLRFNRGAIDPLISITLISVVLLYVYRSFDLYSSPVLTVGSLILILAALALLWNSGEKTLRHYAGTTLLGVLGGGLIYFRFSDLSYISILLGVMTAVLIISLSLLMEEEDEKAPS